MGENLASLTPAGKAEQPGKCWGSRECRGCLTRLPDQEGHREQSEHKEESSTVPPLLPGPASHLNTARAQLRGIFGRWPRI